MQEKLYLYYTNDLHSNFEQWPRVASFLKREKAMKDAAKDSYWLIDIGDHVDRVNPIAEAFMGKANVALLNDLDYDIVTMGNNEGITLPHEDLFHLYDEAGFHVVCANLESLDKKEPHWLQHTVHLKSIQGVRVGFIGLTAPFNAFYELLGWHVSSPYRVLDSYIQGLKDKTDVIVLLSHLGISEDQEIARRFPEIDVIIGGHTHHLLRTGEYVNNTMITAAGKHCFHVGEVVLTWDHEDKRLVHKEAYATDISHLAKDLRTEQSLKQLNDKAAEILGEVVVHTESTVEVGWFKETKIMRELTRTLKDWTETDVAMLNAGLLLDEFPAGDITYSDIHRVCPHQINPCVVQLNGDELLEVVRGSLAKSFTELKLKGFGFRGEVLGRMVFSGLTVETTIREDGEEHVENVLLHNEPLDPEAIYSVATADTFTFGRLLPEIAKSESKQYFLPEFLRDLLADTLRSRFSA
ncbi:bifunctional metallophosphatase/5'-nucleotidase [Virgibacillus kimchii]